MFVFFDNTLCSSNWFATLKCTRDTGIKYLIEKVNIFLKCYHLTPCSHIRNQVTKQSESTLVRDTTFMHGNIYMFAFLSHRSFVSSPQCNFWRLFGASSCSTKELLPLLWLSELETAEFSTVMLESWFVESMAFWCLRWDFPVPAFGFFSNIDLDFIRKRFLCSSYNEQKLKNSEIITGLKRDKQNDIERLKKVHSKKKP